MLALLSYLSCLTRYRAFTDFIELSIEQRQDVFVPIADEVKHMLNDNLIGIFHGKSHVTSDL